MDALTASIILGGSIKATSQLAKGFQQKKAGKAIQADAPEVGTQALDAAKIRAGSSKVPGQDRNEEMLESKTANVLKQGFTTGQPGAISSYISQAMSNLQKNQAQSQVQSAQYMEGNEKDYLSKLAGYESNVFSKQQSDYEKALAAKSSLTTAADQNITGAFDTIGSLGMDYANLKKPKTTK